MKKLDLALTKLPSKLGGIITQSRKRQFQTQEDLTNYVMEGLGRGSKIQPEVQEFLQTTDGVEWLKSRCEKYFKDSLKEK